MTLARHNDGRVWWFGENWHAPICFDCEWAPTPVDAECIFCDARIRMGDCGVLMVGTQYHREPAHVDCLLRNIGVQVTRETLEAP